MVLPGPDEKAISEMQHCSNYNHLASIHHPDGYPWRGAAWQWSVLVQSVSSGDQQENKSQSWASASGGIVFHLSAEISGNGCDHDLHSATLTSVNILSSPDVWNWEYVKSIEYDEWSLVQSPITSNL